MSIKETLKENFISQLELMLDIMEDMQSTGLWDDEMDKMFNQVLSIVEEINND